MQFITNTRGMRFLKANSPATCSQKTAAPNCWVQSSVLHFRRYLGCFQLRSAQSTPRRVGLAARHTASGLWPASHSAHRSLGALGYFSSLLGDGSPPAQGARPDCWLLKADYFSSHVLRAGKNEKRKEEREKKKKKTTTFSSR